ncbi:hypothetical protein CK203_067253 [Vitis vinifera]|uniref:26S proteasome complex subunit SEM1 n=1 Tax=Vitis vinifera TaxID=29760 RepID=A0A438EFP9_VITVI|nr:hypothetical protein CK203_067253 [Vitis vinifera]
MEKEPKVANEDPKVDLFEDDDEFEEFEINEVLGLVGFFSKVVEDGGMRENISDAVIKLMESYFWEAETWDTVHCQRALLPQGWRGGLGVTHYVAAHFFVTRVVREVIDHATHPEISVEWDDKEEGKDTTQQWEDDWDDDDVNDDFSLQLRKELENNAEKS